jgi:hypothetical protein
MPRQGITVPRRITVRPSASESLVGAVVAIAEDGGMAAAGAAEAETSTVQLKR